MSPDPKAILKKLVDLDRPEDGVAAYHALHHPGAQLHVSRDEDGCALFIDAKSRFGPVGILRASAPHLVLPLIATLPPGPRYVMTTWALGPALQETIRIENPERNRIFTLDPERLARFTPEGIRVNRSGDTVRALAGSRRAAECSLLWRSPHFAEIAVETDPEFRGRGIAPALVSEMASYLLGLGVAPLYLASVDNAGSLRVAEKVGFAPCGEDEFAGKMET